ncbi:unnamed protein product [Dovyalis caffra]|uniref:Bet v I/Major latex protein domain-containing protein n=1 Tax=Dovyalis caffra TaxID=77055 RepID=A0AAV1R121_9ROSI|nr:unnamed protein product [Dovyalis caffra]
MQREREGVMKGIMERATLGVRKRRGRVTREVERNHRERGGLKGTLFLKEDVGDGLFHHWNRTITIGANTSLDDHRLNQIEIAMRHLRIKRNDDDDNYDDSVAKMKVAEEALEAKKKEIDLYRVYLMTLVMTIIITTCSNNLLLSYPESSPLKPIESRIMALQGKLETVVELKTPAAKLYNLWKNQAHQVSKHTPNNVQAVNVHHGDWETDGSIKVWNYTIEGKAEMCKEKVEYDDANKKITHYGLEGDVMNFYKVFNISYQFISKGSGSSAKLSVEYEKLNGSIPVPEKYLDLMVYIIKDIDAGLV